MGNNDQPIAFYILGPDGNPSSVDDPVVWARWLDATAKTKQRVVAYTRIPALEGVIKVKTEFLGLDHEGRCPPLLWQTTVDAPRLTIEREPGATAFHHYEGRLYASREAAQAGHDDMVALVVFRQRLRHSNGAKPA